MYAPKGPETVGNGRPSEASLERGLMGMLLGCWTRGIVRTPVVKQIRSTKHEIRNNFKTKKLKCRRVARVDQAVTVSRLLLRDFEFVSDCPASPAQQRVLRISCLTRVAFPSETNAPKRRFTPPVGVPTIPHLMDRPTPPDVIGRLVAA